jgi:AGCS family alanine or glycine:cation symporter
MLVLLVGTGVFLTVRTGFLPWRNLGYALRSVMSAEARTASRGAGDISPFSALMTALAATIGTGNIVGVATALAAGGPGALVWMELSAAFGITSKFSECMLSVKYREVNGRGEMSGGPMYVMKKALKWKALGRALAFFFALFTVIASFGIGDMTQSHSIAAAIRDAFAVPAWVTGAVVTALALSIVVGGIKSISKVSSVVVPVMAVFYLLTGLTVIFGHAGAVPGAVVTMVKMAFCPTAAAGGFAGTITTSLLGAARYGVARGCFSNEAGMGSAAITAASAATDHPVRQGYINMTGTFFDTVVLCTVTGLAICSSGVLGTVGADGRVVSGAALTSLAFETVLGKTGGVLVTVSIALFAFSTLLGWEYHGEKAVEYLWGTKPVPAYRVSFALIAFFGATENLEVVWNISDIFNALMAVPNLICLLLLSDTIAREMWAFQPEVERQKKARKTAKRLRSA